MISHGSSTILFRLRADYAATIAYLLCLLNLLFGLGFFAQLLLLALEKNRYIRFHVAQAMLLSVMGIIVGVAFGVLYGAPWATAPFDKTGMAGFAAFALASMFTCLLGLTAYFLFGLWLWGLASAFVGRATRLPIFGAIARGLVVSPRAMAHHPTATKVNV